MKLTAPKTADEYFKVTEHAVRHFYVGLDSCWFYYKKALEHWDIGKIEQPLTEDNKDSIEKYLELSKKYFDLKFSEAMFAGGILQIAFIAIKLYSSNKSIPNSCETLLQPKHKTAIPFCIGRELHGIPIGLIIYAGRNQYSHWDDEESHEVTSNVFSALSDAFFNNAWSDLAFDLSNPTINVYANEILLTAMKWNSYDKYLQELKSMLMQKTSSITSP
jgi:hypothetical protein